VVKRPPPVPRNISSSGVGWVICGFSSLGDSVCVVANVFS
jgi:hypothetical protein